MPQQLLPTSLVGRRQGATTKVHLNPRSPAKPSAAHLPAAALASVHGPYWLRWHNAGAGLKLTASSSPILATGAAFAGLAGWPEYSPLRHRFCGFAGQRYLFSPSPRYPCTHNCQRFTAPVQALAGHKTSHKTAEIGSITSVYCPHHPHTALSHFNSSCTTTTCLCLLLAKTHLCRTSPPRPWSLLPATRNLYSTPYPTSSSWAKERCHPLFSHSFNTA